MSKIIEILNFPATQPKRKINRRLKLPGDFTYSIIDGKIEKYFPLLKNAARYKNVKIEIKNGVILINNKWEIRSGSIEEVLRGCNIVTLVGLTIGKYLEEKMEKLQKRGDIMGEMVVDALGSECAEESAGYVNEIINREIKKKGFTPAKRFSPGYGGLSLETQKIFFTELKLSEIGMELNDSMLMIPRKSITAFIGWREKEEDRSKK